MSNEKNKIWLPVILIAVAILAWMSILAAGAYWAPNGNGEGGDIRKLWVVVGTTGLFFLLWGFVLYRVQVKSHRKRGQSGSSDSQKP